MYSQIGPNGPQTRIQHHAHLLDEMEQRLREHQTKLGIFAKPPSAENDRIAEENPLEWTDEQIAIWNLFIECLLQLGAINDDNDTLVVCSYLLSSQSGWPTAAPLLVLLNPR